MSKEKILNTLEQHPAGLSISQLAEETDLHRNTVSPAVKELLEEDKVKEKQVGSAKLYYLEKFSGLHNMEAGYEGENIQVGIGVSDLKDGKEAAVSAAKQAAMQAAQGEEPTFSIVFVSSEYNEQVEKVVKGMNKILGEDWIGCTSDRELNSLIGYSQGTVEVLSIQSKYLHFSPVLVENYRENPVEKAQEATQKAVDQANVERSVYATSQYMRSTKKDFSDIIKNPPYFVLTFPGGGYYGKEGNLTPGMEVEFLEGIKDKLGPYIPVLGGCASISMENFFSGKESYNYVFANGDYSKTGAVLSFVVSELYFSYGLDHGYKRTGKIALVTKVSKHGRVIEELDNKPAMERYSELIDVPKDKLLENLGEYSLQYPVSTFDTSQNIYPKVSVRSSLGEEYLQGSFKYSEGQSVMISEFDEESIIKALESSLQNSLEEESFKPALALFATCGMRRVLLKENVSNAVSKVEESYPKLPYFGFYTAGEIGAKRNRRPQYNNITAANLVISDKLQTE